MVTETYYLGELEADCDNCGSNISIELHVVEYPQGVLNYLSMNSTGATITQVAEVEFIDQAPIWLPPAKQINVPESRFITDISEIKNTIPQLIKLIQEDSSHIYRITTREFEEIVAEIFRAQGYQVTLTKRTRDGGKDVIAIHRNILGLETCYFIECKRHALDSKVDVGIVREVYGVHSTINGPNKSVIATTSTFTPDAIQYVNNEVISRWDMELKDIQDVLQWIRNYKL
ncbi:restriction endonuclease [Ectothiorhodospira haloalkaliphila]|uniref:restriction endonuclease n=1 Tax=Ectothiorhodospira haloalkaliphila TaxID=421628 RepID=UPI001EE86C2D|nr:restriction endonuclease [Ectothiorhodospira haloalkaliphila]MCG5526323.1 restriction endonuclease [Ectothiorhodospira haloalkaliphila]